MKTIILALIDTHDMGQRGSNPNIHRITVFKTRFYKNIHSFVECLMKISLCKIILDPYMTGGLEASTQLRKKYFFLQIFVLTFWLCKSNYRYQWSGCGDFVLESSDISADSIDFNQIDFHVRFQKNHHTKFII